MNQTKIDWLIVLPHDGLAGGTEQILLNFVEHSMRNGSHCCVVFLKKHTYGDWDHLKEKCILKYSSFNNIYLGYLLLLPRIIKYNRGLKIHCTFTSQTLINAMLGLLKKIGILKNTRIIVRESNSIFHLLKGAKLKRYALAYRLGYSGVDLVICQTEFMKAQLINSMPWMKKKLKLVVLSNPINLELIANKDKIELLDLKNKKFIVAAGRLVPAKGFDILIHSFSQLNDEFPELKLYILGEGVQRDSLQNLIVKFDLSKKIKLVGFVKNVYPYFKAASVCVLSSRIEGFPNVLLQMMSQNTKVVSTLSAGGIEDIEGVFTCDTESVDQLATTIKQCLLEDTSRNRIKFDENLKQRSFGQFIQNIENYTKTE